MIIGRLSVTALSVYFVWASYANMESFFMLKNLLHNPRTTVIIATQNFVMRSIDGAGEPSYF